MHQERVVAKQSNTFGLTIKLDARYYLVYLQECGVRVVQNLIWWLFVFCLPIFLISSTVSWQINMPKLYEYGFNRYGIPEATGISEPELMKVAQHLVSYFNLKESTAQIAIIKGGEEFDLFNERELIHLEDVRNLVQLDYRIRAGSLVVMAACVLMLLLWFRAKWQVLVRGLFMGGLITSGLIIVLGLWALLGFEQLFILFHLVSFPNEYWILDPATDYLVRLFPGGFFREAALFGFSAVLLEGVSVTIITFGILKLVNKRKMVE